MEFLTTGHDIPIAKLSAGLKGFIIIKTSLEKGILKERNILILNEPEIHMHTQLEEYKLPEILLKYLGSKGGGLFLDFVACSIITENNVAQYYLNYAYNHPLFTERMHMCSDSKISDLQYWSDNIMNRLKITKEFSILREEL